jgi:hypothetical protein
VVVGVAVVVGAAVVVGVAVVVGAAVVAVVVGATVVVSASIVDGVAAVVGTPPVADFIAVAGSLASELPPHPAATKRSARRTANIFTDSVCHLSVGICHLSPWSGVFTNLVHTCKHEQSDRVNSAARSAA